MSEDLKTYLANSQAAELTLRNRALICQTVERQCLGIINRYVAPDMYAAARRHLEQEIALFRESA